MKCSAYIAASVDGFIARPDGSIDWLQTAGNPEAGVGEGYIDFETYIASVDCMIMGRKCMDIISSFDLSPEQWPYGALKIVVLSNTVQTPPDNLKDKVKMYSGDLTVLLDELERDGYRSAYIDGGATIQNFINLGRLNEITITQMPILIGDGAPLFGSTLGDVDLIDAQAVVCPNDYIQFRYRIKKGQPKSRHSAA
ncbi:dihydrofolate reductase family protein [uncultured Shimia sp.]|uniref:dihydrofolate reductase family protein n=1 Tax=uncultured Shimia sp. TaxID=573152 RepID=UPI00262F4DF1|nr:dihydrofolate reductase family protein [uncultured Shimia sp.]